MTTGLVTFSLLLVLLEGSIDPLCFWKEPTLPIAKLNCSDNTGDKRIKINTITTSVNKFDFYPYY